MYACMVCMIGMGYMRVKRDERERGRGRIWIESVVAPYGMTYILYD